MSRMEPGPAGQVLVTGGGPCPRDEAGRPRSVFRVGDVLRVSCPFLEAEVVGAHQWEVRVRWPWRQADVPSAPGGDGEVVFPLDQRASRSLFQLDREPGRLRPGDRCRVGIAPRVIHVAAIRRWFPDQDLGWRHRCLCLWVLPQGVPHDLGEDVEVLDAYGAEPVRVELLARLYGFLDDLDVVADRRGRRWEFCRPYWWVEVDRDDEREGLPAPLAGPAWPLTLLAGRDGGDPEPMQAERVTRVTVQGDHPGHLAAWSELAGAPPVPAEDQHPPVRPQPFLDRAAAEAERAQTRAELLGLSFTQVLRAFSHAWVERLQIVEDAGDAELGPMLERTELRLGEMADVLRQLRARAAAIYSG